MTRANQEIVTAVTWERLAGQHGIAVVQPTLRTYVTNHPPRLVGYDNCPGDERK